MSTINDGGPAFPRDHAHDGHNGMTMRDYFAAKALTGLLAQVQEPGIETVEMFAQASYKLADAMLRARESKQ